MVAASSTVPSLAGDVAAVPAPVAAPEPDPCPQTRSLVGPLPKLTTDLETELAAYGNDPTSWDVDTWMDSGGPAGGGVPASAVRTLMRRGLAVGLTSDQVRSFLQPAFLRGMSDPWGGAWLFDFIGQQHDPALLEELASYAGALNGRDVSPISAQAHVFEAIPSLRVAYMAQAGAMPPDLATAEPMLSLANQGYVPAQRTIQAFLAAGNHPSAGAQDAGGVPDLMRADVYDYFVANYVGPLSPDAAAAMANRAAYNSWVERIANWEGGGALMDQGARPGLVPRSRDGISHRDLVRHRGGSGSGSRLLTTPDVRAPRAGTSFED